jgi:glycine/D-amino acid oxidase-like deaminating enzyme
MARPWPDRSPSSDERAVYADALPRPFWLDGLPARPSSDPPPAETDLCIVGGGFTGLWAALQAGREAVLLESETVGFGASGRNGGFVSSSLTHGLANGMARFSGEMPLLDRLGRENYDGLVADIARHGIDCSLEETGELTAALEPHELTWLREDAALLERFGHSFELLDGHAMRAEVASPTYLGGLWHTTGQALVDPGRLAVGLRDAAVRAGVQVHERTRVEGLAVDGDGVAVRTSAGTVRARRVLLATSAYPPLVRAIRRYVVPVYDYVLVSEPLTPAQRDALGWRRRQGLSDAGNLFHYYRLTPDDRILWGGYDAVSRFRGGVGHERDECDATFGRLARNFFATFPQLRGSLKFEYRWGGAIDTCSRFSVFFGQSLGGRVAYATGYTGLGVGATRFGARVALDLLDGRSTDATRSRYVCSKPVPFPPEPLRTAAIQLTRNRLAAADRNEGRRGLWLRTLDRLGLGFDS